MSGPRVLRFREARGGTFPAELSHALGFHVGESGANDAESVSLAIADFFGGCAITVTEETTPGTTTSQLAIAFEFPRPTCCHGAGDEEVH